MQKESRKCDSVRVALNEKDSLILDLVDSNLKMYDDFNAERQKKEAAQSDLDKAQKKLNSFDKKRFGVGMSAGATLNSSFEVKPAILIGISYSIFRF